MSLVGGWSLAVRAGLWWLSAWGLASGWLASPPDLEQVRGGAGEVGLGLGGGLSAAGVLAQPVTVFEVPVDGFDDR
ncbi:MAG TPA: hypothetical protein VJN19_00745, partial [Propionibacteriaceae bacterium]|nr:hypothetical protein [Propionibacteriaceae bacterium]